MRSYICISVLLSGCTDNALPAAATAAQPGQTEARASAPANQHPTTSKGEAGTEAPSAAVSSNITTAGGAPAVGSGGDGCPERFTVATRASVDMSWPETVGYLAGQSKLQAWSKTTHTRTAAGTTSEVTPCGVTLPVVTTTLLLDNVLLANEIPATAFDLPSMPRSSGSSWLQAGAQMIDMGVMALGADLSDINAAWPVRAQLPLADHDADGRPGVTALPKTGGNFGLPPADVGQTEHADEIYIASRLALRFTTQQSLCDPHLEGSVEPLGFDYTIVGCHVLGGAECKANQVNLLDNNDPAFVLGAQGRWTGIAIAESDSCAAVLAALPAE